MSEDATITPDGTATVEAPAAAAPAAPPGGYRLAMRFSGSGSEYFRIWIVNLLLILVTVGLYYPFAKVRRLRYFYGNTQLGGEEFDFHGSPWKMLRGFLLMAAFAGAYALATNASPWAALVALVAFAAIWPALFRASLQFRLANTSWRGLRFQFLGTTADAYRAMWPMLLAMFMYLGAAAFVQPKGQAAAGEPPAAMVVIMLVGLVLVMLLMPWFWYSIKRYQHGNYALGPMRTELRAKAGSFYGVFLKAAGLALLCMVPMIIVAIGGSVLAAILGSGKSKGAGPVIGFVLFGGAMVLSYVVMLVVAGAFVTSRLQNLVWGSTRGRDVKFASALKARALAKLTAKNWLLTVLTLGLYIPFARVAKAKLLIEAVEVTTRHPPQVLTAALRGMGGDAAGDAAGDLLEFDVEL